MKTLIISAALTYSLAFVQVSAVAGNRILPTTDVYAMQLCKAIQSGSQLQLKKAMKKAHTSYKEIAKDLVCNGHDAITFAQLSDADKTAAYIAHKANLNYQQVANIEVAKAQIKN